MNAAARKRCVFSCISTLLLYTATPMVDAGSKTPSQSTHARSAHDDDDDDDASDEALPVSRKADPLSVEQIKQAYRVFAKDPRHLSSTPPQMPDLSRYTPAAVAAKIDRSVPGFVTTGPLLSEPGFNSLTTAIGQGLREFASRQRGGLRSIIVQGGHVELAQLARTLAKEVFEETERGVYVARLPILIRHGASLELGPAVKELRLSRESGALIANEGKLFVMKSAIIGWSERDRAPAWFHDKHEFRPFIVGWGGSETYISESRIAHLGHAITKSYGLSFSQYSSMSVERIAWPRPTGWVLNSVIEDLWYGFYCWEADDVVLRGNTFRNNIKYGIDPHDRSRRLIIAGNDVFGTKQKHGIIISREVNNSWIIGNRSHENQLSGIVLDRQCRDTVIADNLTYQNHADGIVISESSHNLVWSNLSSGNRHHGIRLRNSTDVTLRDNSSVANGLSGIYAVAQDLSATVRDLQEDPYQKALSMVVTGGQISANKSGPIHVDDASRVEMFNIDFRTPQRELGYRFGGVLLAFQIDALDILVRRKQALVLEAQPNNVRITASNP